MTLVAGLTLDVVKLRAGRVFATGHTEVDYLRAGLASPETRA
jgi:hypothetical protein